MNNPTGSRSWLQCEIHKADVGCLSLAIVPALIGLAFAVWVIFR